MSKLARILQARSIEAFLLSLEIINKIYRLISIRVLYISFLQRLGAFTQSSPSQNWSKDFL